jgi:hypothetical protein
MFRITKSHEPFSWIFLFGRRMTVQVHGLKKRNLSRHRREVQDYFSKLSITGFDTELAISYQKRLLKNKDKLFTFIEYDGIP